MIDGHFVGLAMGLRVGGFKTGFFVGTFVGTLVGFFDGVRLMVGSKVGFRVAIADGIGIGLTGFNVTDGLLELGLELGLELDGFEVDGILELQVDGIVEDGKEDKGLRLLGCDVGDSGQSTNNLEVLHNSSPSKVFGQRG